MPDRREAAECVGQRRRRPRGGRAARRARRCRYSRNTGRSLATTGSPALIASSTASPKPSLTDGKAKRVGGAVPAPASRRRARVPRRTTSRPSARPSPGRRGQHARRGRPGSPGRSGRRPRPAPARVDAPAQPSQRLDQVVAALAGLDAARRQEEEPVGRRRPAPAARRRPRRRRRRSGATSTPLWTTGASTP